MKCDFKVIAEGLNLGEGCIWDEERNQIHYVDITDYKIYSYSMHTGETRMLDMGNYVGCIILDEKGQLIAAVKDRLISIDLETGRQCEIMQVEQPDFVRFNDGKMDPYGNLWIGTMAMNQSHPKAKGIGKLYCIKGQNIQAQYGGFTIPNGLAWDNRAHIFYHIDTPTRRVDAYDMNENTIANRRTVIRVLEAGTPDGMCMDADGNLWVALWGGYKVVCYNPVNGEKLKEIGIPDKNVSCCAFVGKKQNLLCVTTAQDEKGKGGKVYLIQL